MKDSLYYHVQQLLTYNTIALDQKELAFQIQSHPSYPSLHAVTGVLDHFNVDNIALDVPVNQETLVQLPKSFLAQVKTKQGEQFAVVVNKGLYYNVILSKKKKDKLTIAKFLNIFTGIVVAVEKTDVIDDKKNNSKLFDYALIGISSMLLLGLFYLAKPSIVSALFLFTSIIGIVISVAIKKQEQGVQTILGNAFCSGASDAKDCDAVLTSKGANIFNNYKLSDIGLIYFTGLTLAVFALILFNLNLAFPYAIGLIAFPITLYSIYYQAIIVKKWCLLCLSVVVVLWAQAVLVALNFNILTSFSWSLNSALLTGLGFLSALTIWNLLVPQLTELQELKQLKIDHFKFKRNFNLFNTLLEKSKTIDTTISDVSEIVFGNPSSNLEITLVTSPFCGHCKPVHTLVENILKKYSENVKILIRFNANVSNPDNNLVKITSRLIEIYNTEGATACLTAMHSIYNGQQSEHWLQEFGACQNTEDTFSILKKENDWCTTHNINFTPELLINGRSFPKEYNRSDLIYFIEDLNEKYTVENIIEPQLTI